MIDFMVGLMLFLVAIAFITSQFDLRLNEANKESDLETMRIKANYAVDFLVKSPGIPSNWESLPIDDLNKLGIAKTDRVMSEEKINAFSSGTYEKLRSALELNAYDFFFKFTGVDDFNAGFQPPSNANNIMVERIVRYKNETGVVKLNVYYLE